MKQYRRLLFLIAITAIGACIPRFLFYLGGFLNNRIAIIPIFILFFTPIGWGFVIAVTVLSIHGSRHRTNKSLIYIAPAVFLIGYITTGILVPLVGLGSPGAVTFLQGYEKWVNRNINTLEIQKWIMTADKDYWWGDRDSSDHRFYGLSQKLPDDLPKCIPSTMLKYLVFERSDLDGGEFIRLEWGGALAGHWGIIIGDPQMKMPTPGVKEIPGSSEFEYRRILHPGIYIYDRG